MQPPPHAEEQIVEVADVARRAVEPLAQGRGGMVDLDEGGEAGLFRQPRADRDTTPPFQGGRADEAHGLDIERAGHREADAEHAAETAARTSPGRLLLAQGGDKVSDRIKGRGGLQARELALAARDHRAAEIDQSRFDAARRHVDSDRMAAIGIDAERGRGIAAPAALLAGTQQEALGLELADDGRDGLHGEADALGDLAARDRALQPDRLEHDPPVVRPAVFLVGPFEGHPFTPSLLRDLLLAVQPALAP